MQTAIKLKYKPDFEEARKYWDAFWMHEMIDRPCTVIWAKKQPQVVESQRLQPVEQDFQKTFAVFDRHLETYEFMGDNIPGFRPGFGPDQVAAFLGAPLLVSPDSPDTSWTEKIVTDWAKFLPLKIEPDNRAWQRMHAFHEAAAKHFEGKCLLYNIDLHTNIDGLEALRGAQALLYDILDEPDLVHEAMRQIRRLYPMIYDAFGEYGNKATLGSNSGMHLYSRGKTAFIQADFIALLNPELMHEFVLPAIEEEAAFLDHCAFHLDGPDALKYLDDILAIPDIDAVQWQAGAGKPPNWQWPEVIHKIQAAGKAAILYATPAEIKTFHKNFKPELLVYDVLQCNSPEEGQDLLDWLVKNS
jgi:5-methyltetrahydrofolate--homocysteine methyltransferase